MKYRAKPVEIEAFKFEGEEQFIADETGAVPFWLACAIANAEVGFSEGVPVIETLEGTMTVSPGDYIIKGTQGEIYPCKSDIFEGKYEPVTEPRGE